MTPKKKEEAFPIKAVANRVAAIPVEEAPMSSVIAVPDRAHAPYGKTASGLPHKMGKIVHIGSEVKQDLKIGDIILIDGMNTNKVKVGDQEYYLPVPQAILFVVEDD